MTLLQDYYLNFEVLDKLENYKRKEFLRMYNRLLDYVSNPPDFSNFSREKEKSSSQNQFIQHIFRNLLEYDILIDERTVKIQGVLNS